MKYLGGREIHVATAALSFQSHPQNCSKLQPQQCKADVPYLGSTIQLMLGKIHRQLQSTPGEAAQFQCSQQYTSIGKYLDTLTQLS